MASTNPARGMRDFLPPDVRRREYVIGVIKSVYESYGFEPLETPAVENLETLTGKYGDEGNQLIFKILKRGDKLDESLETRDKGQDSGSRLQSPVSSLADLALRYDLTVPLARVVANHKNDLPKFFKRYQIQPVWRADRPARGRFREFYQCDVDAIGSSSMVVEAELVSAVCEVLTRLGFEDFVVRFNHRGLLKDILDAAGVAPDKHADALVSLDKIDKIGRGGVEKEFLSKGIANEAGQKILALFSYFVKGQSSAVFGEKAKQKLLELQKRIAEHESYQKDFARLLSFDVAKIQDQNSFDVYKELLLSVMAGVQGAIDSNRQFLANVMPVIDREYLEDLKKTYVPPDKQKYQRHYTNGSRLELVHNFIGRGEISAAYDELLQFLYSFVEADSVFTNNLLFDPSLARGLSYYTGTIMEINVDGIGSLGGGGRYDGLIGMFGKEQIPACGFSLGLERILVVMEERGMFPPEIADSTPADVMVTMWSDETVGESLKLANELRAQGLRVTLYPEADKLGKQIKYADTIKVPWVCVLGESEIADGTVTLKNMKTGEQQAHPRAETASKIV